MRLDFGPLEQTPASNYYDVVSATSTFKKVCFASVLWCGLRIREITQPLYKTRTHALTLPHIHSLPQSFTHTYNSSQHLSLSLALLFHKARLTYALPLSLSLFVCPPLPLPFVCFRRLSLSPLAWRKNIRTDFSVARRVSKKQLTRR